MAMASYNVWFFTYVVCLFRPGEKIRLKTFITPTNIATVAMLVLLATGWRLPAPVQQFCSAVGGCTTPLALMIVGVLLADSDIRALLHTGFLYRVTLLRGILFPLLFMLLLWLLPLDNVLRTGLSIIAWLPGRQPCRCAGQADRHRSDPCQSGGGPLHRVYAGHSACHAAADRCDVPDVRSCKARCLWTAGFLLL